jgi:hypothetical protein
VPLCSRTQSYKLFRSRTSAVSIFSRSSISIVMFFFDRGMLLFSHISANGQFRLRTGKHRREARGAWTVVHRLAAGFGEVCGREMSTRTSRHSLALPWTGACRGERGNRSRRSTARSCRGRASQRTRRRVTRSSREICLYRVLSDDTTDRYDQACAPAHPMPD